MLVRQLFIMKSWEINPSVKAEIKKKKKNQYIKMKVHITNL